MRPIDARMDMDEFTEFLWEQTRKYMNRKMDEAGEEITPEEVHEDLFVKGRIPQVGTRISDFIYFISDGQYVKIGKGMPMDRLKTMQTGNARQLKLLFTIPLGNIPKSSASTYKTAGIPAEMILHRIFKNYHVRGEWFDILGRISVSRFREWFGVLHWTGERDIKSYRMIVERRKKEDERDTLEAAD